MLGDITIATELYVVCGYTDMRKSIDGLCTIIRDYMHMEPENSNALFLFCGKRCDRIKALLKSRKDLSFCTKGWTAMSADTIGRETKVK